jgi:hypothetical protein
MVGVADLVVQVLGIRSLYQMITEIRMVCFDANNGETDGTRVLVHSP